MIKQIMILWFKWQGGKAAKAVLSAQYSGDDIKQILKDYWAYYLKLKPDIPLMPTLGGKLMLNLAAISTAFHEVLVGKGQTSDQATKLFYQIAWQVYAKMGKLSWVIAGWTSKNKFTRLKKTTQYFRTFPFNSPTYGWDNVREEGNMVGFDCVKCPVAEYFQKKGLSKFCENTWCALDYPLAEMWDAKLDRSGSIAGGAEKCDFKWISNDKSNL